MIEYVFHNGEYRPRDVVLALATADAERTEHLGRIAELRDTLFVRPRKRVMAGLVAALSVATFGATCYVSADAEAATPRYAKARAFLALDNTNALNTVAFHDVELSTVKTAALDTALDAAAQQQCLSEAIYYEARSEAVRGQKAIAEVIHNRVASRFYPNTICDVVYQGQERALRTGRHNCQFSFTCDGSLERWIPVGELWDQAQQIAAVSIEGSLKEQTRGATHYHTTYVRPGWSKRLKRTKQIGKHKFYLDLPMRRKTWNDIEVAP